MVEGVNNLISLIQGGTGKKTAGSDADSGGFEALLAILLGQSFNFPGNNMSGLEGMLSAEDMAQSANGGIPDMLNILDSLNLLTANGQRNSMEIKQLISSLTGDGEANFPPDMAELIDDTGNVQGMDVDDMLLDVLIETAEEADKQQVLEEPEAAAQASPKKAQNSSANANEMEPSSYALPDTAEAPVDTGKTTDSMPAVQYSNVPHNVPGVKNAEPDGGASAEAASVPAKFDSGAQISAIQSNTAGMTEDKYTNIQDDAANTNDRIENLRVQKSDYDNEQYIIQRPEVIKLMKSFQTSEPVNTKVDKKTLGETFGKQDVNGKTVAASPEKNVDLPVEMSSKNETDDKASDDGRQALQLMADSTKTAESVSQDTQVDFKQQLSQPNTKDSVMNQIYDKIKVLNSKDVSEIQVNLKPDELGQVTIKLVMDKGVLVGKILVESNQVKSLIESNVPQIKENLKNQNLNVAEFTVSANLNQDNQTGYQYQGFSGRWHVLERRFHTMSSVPEEHIEQTAARAAYSTGKLNLLA